MSPFHIVLNQITPAHVARYGDRIGVLYWPAECTYWPPGIPANLDGQSVACEWARDRRRAGRYSFRFIAAYWRRADQETPLRTFEFMETP